ncbi:PRC-barrel domain-containing protein [Moorellaceae bacterium AZ2]
MYHRSKKLAGMPVISLADGQALGRIRRLLIDHQNLAIAGLILDRKGWFKEQAVIPYSHVNHVGSHAVTVDQASAVVKLSSVPELENLAKNPIPLLGAKVITEDGAVLGVVEDFFFQPQDGKIRYLELKGHLLQGKSQLPAEVIRTCGRDALIAQAGAENSLKRPKSLASLARWERAAAAGEKISHRLSSYLQRLPWNNKNDG